MAIIKDINFNRKALKGVATGDTIENCNCTQQNVNTAVCAGLKGLTVKNSNVRNCVFPKTTVFEGCEPYQEEIIPKPDPTPAENCDKEMESIKKFYGDAISKAEAKKVFDLKESAVI